ncbi:11970_t:CDS:2 [Funneliformis geosporum]|uniref:11970_t:CDS:1 n=1 Tax=Funneliformis geosporum TaxID=1117311 RepID=A0A9W4WX68_9GLOM|nr:11970_t:CDS:2 [Funneliformis geosporum]
MEHEDLDKCMEHEDSDEYIEYEDLDEHIEHEDLDEYTEYENLDKYINTNYSSVDIYHNPQILNVDETIKQVVFWVYLFQDIFLLPQTASAILLDFFKELLQSFNENKFLDFPLTIYHILNGKDQHIRCKCNEIITKTVRTSKGNHLIKSIKTYSYHSIIQQLGLLLSKPGIEALLESYWFNPCKHIQNSVGVIYLTILNLPRHMQFREENTFVVRIIPGPHEPNVNEIHQYIDPLVDELLQLLASQVIQSPNYSIGRVYRAALIMISCDTPTVRKIGGFSGHSSKRECYRYDHTFPTIQDSNTGYWKPDFSNFDTNFPQRSKEKHRSIAYKFKNASPTIYPMHNLYLDTAKRMIKAWTSDKQPLIFTNDFKKIQNIVDITLPPSDIGCIPLKIASRFAGFSVDRQTIISLEDIENGDLAIKDLLNKIKSIWGLEIVTPNMQRIFIGLRTPL